MTALQLPTYTTSSGIVATNVYLPIIGVTYTPQNGTPYITVSLGFYASRETYIANSPPIDSGRNFLMPNPVPQSAINAVAVNGNVDIFQVICALFIADTAQYPIFTGASIVT